MERKILAGIILGSIVIAIYVFVIANPNIVQLYLEQLKERELEMELNAINSVLEACRQFVFDESEKPLLEQDTEAMQQCASYTQTSVLNYQAKLLRESGYTDEEIKKILEEEQENLLETNESYRIIQEMIERVREIQRQINE